MSCREIFLPITHGIILSLWGIPIRGDPGVTHARTDDDGVLRRLGIAGTVIALPGHTLDSIGIVLYYSNAVVGDAADAGWG